MKSDDFLALKHQKKVPIDLIKKTWPKYDCWRRPSWETEIQVGLFLHASGTRDFEKSGLAAAFVFNHWSRFQCGFQMCFTLGTEKLGEMKPEHQMNIQQEFLCSTKIKKMDWDRHDRHHTKTKGKISNLTKYLKLYLKTKSGS